MTGADDDKTAGALMTARTRNLARRASAAPAATETGLRMAVLCAPDFYAIALSAIAHIVSAASLGRSARAHGAIAGLHGLVGLGGVVYNVVDLSALLGQTVQARDEGEGGHLLLLREPVPRVALLCTRVETIANIVPLAGTRRDEQGLVAARGRTQNAPDTLSGVSVGIIDLARLYHMLSHRGELRS